jgi:non-specific serine/threonine protein kinase/serine/threonine-protein kinase
MRKLRGDLDWIVMRALEKERSRRYSSPNELAAEVRRHLDDEPVLATPPSTTYRLAKYVRRHRVGVAATAAVFVALVVGLIAASIGWREALVQGRRAQTALSAEQAQRAEAVLEREKAEAARADAETQRELAQAREVEARTEAARANSIADLLQSALVAAAPGTRSAQSKDYTVRELLESLEEQLGERLNGDPEAEFAFRRTLAAARRGLADDSQAEAHLLRSIELAGQIFPDQSLEHALLWNDLGEVRILMWNPAEAEQDLERAAAACDPEEPRQHDLLVTVRNNQAVLAMRNGRLAECEAFALQALALQEDARPDHTHRGTVLTTLGNLARERGDKQAAAEWLSQALEAYRTTDNSRNATFAGALSSWAMAALEADPSADVEPAFEEALLIMRRLYDRPHHDLASTLNNYGTFLVQRNRLEEAEASLTEGLAQLEALGAPDRNAVILLTANLGSLAWQLGDKALAAERAQKALELHEQWFAPDDRQAIFLRTNLVRSLRAIGDAPRALPFVRTQVEVCRRVLGATHADTVEALEKASEACAVASWSAKGEARVAREAEGYARELLAAREAQSDGPQLRWKAKLLLSDALLSCTLTSADAASASLALDESIPLAESAWNAPKEETTKEQRQAAARQLNRAFKLRAKLDPTGEAPQRAEEWRQRAEAP